MKLVYVAGPYRGDIDANIAEARRVAIQLWEAGHVVICPHLNTAHFEQDCKCPEEAYLAGDLLMLAHCDAIVLLENWYKSKGAQGELKFALEHGIRVHVWPDMPEEQ